MSARPRHGPPDDGGWEGMDFSKHEGGPYEEDAHTPRSLPVVAISELGDMRHLGSGEFCNVSESTLNGGAVAVKRLKERQQGNPTALRDIKLEIELMGLMRHPNVLRPTAFCQHPDGSPMLVMPVISTILSNELPKAPGSVPVWTRRTQCKRWPLIRGLRCGLQLAEALHYCHSEAMEGTRILHRDIKPSNIGFLANGRLVLFDFGLARLWDIEADDTETRQLTGQTGSLRYMAPEVALSQPYNHRAEVFSFATCLWQMCSHEIPFFEMDVESFIARVAKGSERPSIKSSWPPALQQLLRECWSATHNERPDIGALLPVLKNLVDTEQGTSASARTPRSGTPRGSGRS